MKILAENKKVRRKAGKVEWYMRLGRILKSKKFRNICVTLLEILVVAAIIMGILMTVQSKLKTSNGTGTGSNQTENNESEEVQDDAGDEYYIEINIKKSAVIVYRYNKEKSDKSPIKVVNASVGRSVKTGKYKMKETYTWLNTNNESWNKYNTRYDENGWIQSVDYTDKYSWTLDKNSYKAIGTRQSDDANIKLTAKDAQWISSNCGEGTIVKIINGKKSDELPMEMEEITELKKYCAWDPTDPAKGNPYKKMTDGEISLYNGTVYVEKGTAINYYANVIALDESGKNITGKLKYDEIDTSAIGNHKVKYSYKTKDGKSLQGTMKYSVIDTTVPIVTISQYRFTYEVASANEKDLNKQSVKEAIENLVRSHASASEGSIKVTALPKEQLVIGDNYVRVVATDAAGNVGSAEAVVEIKVKEKKLNEKYVPKNKKEEETTKKKKNKNKEDETTKKSSEDETKVSQETTSEHTDEKESDSE